MQLVQLVQVQGEMQEVEAPQVLWLQGSLRAYRWPPRGVPAATPGSPHHSQSAEDTPVFSRPISIYYRLDFRVLGRCEDGWGGLGLTDPLLICPKYGSLWQTAARPLPSVCLVPPATISDCSGAAAGKQAPRSLGEVVPPRSRSDVGEVHEYRGAHDRVARRPAERVHLTQPQVRPHASPFLWWIVFWPNEPCTFLSW